MPKRRADADGRRFFDGFASVRVSRLRASGVIHQRSGRPSSPFPGGKQKLVGTAHVHFPNGEGYSYSPLPEVPQARGRLYLIDDAPPQAF
jgi:hypothetical protein